VELVCSSFDNVIVVINANNAMELDWVDDYDSIGAVILAPGTGAAGMAARITARYSLPWALWTVWA